MMDLERLAAALGADEVVGAAPVEVLDLAYDARHVTPGAAFFCVPGARADGHDFAPEAVSNGAVALVVERRWPSTSRSSSSPTPARRWRSPPTSSSDGRRRRCRSPA